MPKIKRSRKPPPEGWELIEPTLEELEAKMREAETDSHEGKRKTETLWPIFKVHHQKSRYVYELFYRRKAISRELYDYCIKEKIADPALIAKWKKQGYENLCCLRCIQTAMNQTFYLTNIVPQDLENNGNYWNRLEIYCRDLTKLYQDVYIISGPLWLPEEDKTSKNDKPQTSDQTKTSKLTVVDVEQKLTETPASSIIGASAGDVVVKPKWVRPPRPPKKFVKYEVIGTNNVAVPSHLFKVILVEDPQLDKPMMASFIIPNKPVQDVKLEDFEVSLLEVEKQVGVRFHQDLDHESGVDRLCLMDGCQLNNYKQFQEFFWTRRIKTPLNSRFLENDWKEVCKRGMSTPELQEIYLTKKQELLEKETQRREEKANPGGDDKPAVIKIGPVLEEATNTNPEGLKRNPASAA